MILSYKFNKNRLIINLFFYLISYIKIGGKMNKEEFKNFVKNRPYLIKYVNNGEMTWQKFYEMYSLYGDSDDVWKDYVDTKIEKKESKNLNDILSYFKNINLDNIQNSVDSIQRVLGVFQDIKDNNVDKKEYKPRPIYKHFDD